MNVLISKKWKEVGKSIIFICISKTDPSSTLIFFILDGGTMYYLQKTKITYIQQIDNILKVY